MKISSIKFKIYHDECAFWLAFSPLHDNKGIRGFFFEFVFFRTDLYWRDFSWSNQ